MPDISKIYPEDRHARAEVVRLLEGEGIRLDKNLDYTCGIYDDDYNHLIATGSCFKNTLRCFAVDSRHQGEGLLNLIITHLIEYQHAEGNHNFFLYTKCSTSKFFNDLGFKEIARVPGELVFMENRRQGFADYLQHLQGESPAPLTGQKIAALVMNANPFTLGHQYLVEKAAAENDLVHLFMVSEDASLVPFKVRKELIKAGTAHLKNLVYHESGPYIISSATFPSYFQKDDAAVSSGHAKLDITIFQKIAAALSITRRYVGEEPFSQVTNIYNKIMQEDLPKAGIELVIVPRKEDHGLAISASSVRQAIKDGAWDTLAQLVPPTTLNFFKSPAAAPVIAKIKAASDVVHH
jgi:[citrate (pro-3S)-lyase] ligase